MFDFLRRSRRSKQPDVDGVGEVRKHLRVMGYELTPYGTGVALLSIKSGYNPVEVASHIAHVTLALDVREAWRDPDELERLALRGMALLEILKKHKDSGAMPPTQWKNDARAVMGIIMVNQEQEGWVERVLGDPVAGKERLATRSA
jgi:hypothetical protein